MDAILPTADKLEAEDEQKNITLESEYKLATNNSVNENAWC